MNNEILMSLMQQVEYRVDNLLNVLANNQYEIHRLQNENNQLRNDYVRILDQINIYVNELEEVNHPALQMQGLRLWHQCLIYVLT